MTGWYDDARHVTYCGVADDELFVSVYPNHLNAWSVSVSDCGCCGSAGVISGHTDLEEFDRFVRDLQERVRPWLAEQIEEKRSGTFTAETDG